MKIIYFLLVMICMHAVALAQEILGTITDSTREPIIYASVAVTQGGILKGGTITDIDGKYSVKPLEPGYYDVTVSYQSYKTTTILKVIVSPGERTRLNFILKRAAKGDTSTLISKYKRPLIDPYNRAEILPGCGGGAPRERITQGVDLVAVTPGIYYGPGHGYAVDRDGGRTIVNIVDSTVDKATREAQTENKPRKRHKKHSRNVYLIDGVEVKGAPHIATWGAHGEPQFRKISIRKLRYKHYIKKLQKSLAHDSANGK